MSTEHRHRRILTPFLRLLLVLAGILLPVAMKAVTEEEIEAQLERYGRPDVFRGRYHTVIDGDTVLVLYFNDITVYPPMKFKNKKEEEFYWRTVRDVKKALPYAKMINETLIETYEYIQTFDTKKERDKYLNDMEGAIFEQYKPALKKFTKSQANMLVKLIQRETNQSGYDIVKAFLGSVRAMFWQGFGKLFGVNIKGSFKPDSNKNDAIIERVATLVEQGQL